MTEVNTNTEKINSLERCVAVMARDIEFIKEGLGDIKKMVEAIESKVENLNQKFVTKEEFDPIKRLVYGVTALALTALATAIFTSFIVK